MNMIVFEGMSGEAEKAETTRRKSLTSFAWEKAGVLEDLKPGLYKCNFQNVFYKKRQ